MLIGVARKSGILFVQLSFLFTKASCYSMQATRNDGMGGKGVQFVPKSGQYSNLLIFLHGLGDTADGWASMMPSLKLEDTKIVLPTAKSRPITFNDGYPMPGWSDIFGLSIEDREDREGFDESAARINAIVQKEIDGGIDPRRIVLAGFSQGGAVVLHTALRSPHTLGGCVALSTWLPLRSDFPEALSGSAKELKILQVHGDADNVVAYSWGKTSHDLLLRLGLQHEPQFLTIQGMGHSSDPEEMEAVKAFLAAQFAK